MPELTLVRSRRAVPSDEDIKEIAGTDRRRGIDLVARKYRDRLFNHALYIVKDYQEAIDVTQEVFIKALREDRFFADDFKMKAWLFRVTSNLCFNIVRDRRRRGTILDTVVKPMVKQRTAAARQFELVFTGEKQERILQAMESLTEDHREILMLRYYDDLSYAEIADTLEIKLGTVMSRLSRAKGKLLEVLDVTGVVEET